MLQATIKVLLTSLLVVAASEAGKRNVLAGAVIASLPLTSVLAMSWLYFDTGDTQRVSALAHGIFWLILPSLILLLALPFLLNRGWGFLPSLAVSVTLTTAGYLAMIALLNRVGISI